MSPFTGAITTGDWYIISLDDVQHGMSRKTYWTENLNFGLFFCKFDLSFNRWRAGIYRGLSGRHHFAAEKSPSSTSELLPRTPRLFEVHSKGHLISRTTHADPVPFLLYMIAVWRAVFYQSLGVCLCVDFCFRLSKLTSVIIEPRDLVRTSRLVDRFDGLDLHIPSRVGDYRYPRFTSMNRGSFRV